MKKQKAIYFTERNTRGAWVVYGVIGIKQYYYYTKTQAQQLYKQEVQNTNFINK